MIEKGCLENTDDFFDQIDGLLGGGEIGGLEGCFSAAGDGEVFSGSSFSSAYSGDSVSSMEEDFAAGLSFPVSFPLSCLEAEKTFSHVKMFPQIKYIPGALVYKFVRFFI